MDLVHKIDVALILSLLTIKGFLNRFEDDFSPSFFGFVGYVENLGAC